ncbi:arabinogalactan protein 1-like [Phaseolus vulgaris]|uniref:arabinogalactan protein 1-like n=1 Tax=Phaseolus vulgaris TaxID=3885 RepID=UPI0035CAD7ED
MDASKRMMLAKAMKEARAAKAGASSTPAADPVPPPTLSPPPPITAEAPLSSSPSSPHSPAALQAPGSPLPIAAVPLATASSPAPTPLDKGKRVLEILSDDEDSEGVAPFKRRKSAWVPLLLETSPQGGNPFMDDPLSATSFPPATVQEEGGEGAESASPPPPVEVSASPAPAVEVSWLRVEKEALEKQVASGDAAVEELEKDKKALIQEMAGTFEEGFQEALAQAVCTNPGIDISSCDSTHHIVDGKVVPLELVD